ncbi:MAG TPA: hypothetical protein DCG51_07105 [Erysipelotrichaceae bacterium]|nr:hypothetical protein [Erysipelotrichaceae bacterium]
MTQEKELICVNCPMGCRVHVVLDGKEVISVTGNTCPRGKEYAIQECIQPMRILTSTVRITGASARVIPVITEQAIPLDKMSEAMQEIRQMEVQAPIKIGTVLTENLAGTGVRLVTSRTMS